jgi:hypothetical protein
MFPFGQSIGTPDLVLFFVVALVSFGCARLDRPDR